MPVRPQVFGWTAVFSTGATKTEKPCSFGEGRSIAAAGLTAQSCLVLSGEQPLGQKPQHEAKPLTPTQTTRLPLGRGQPLDLRGWIFYCQWILRPAESDSGHMWMYATRSCYFSSEEEFDFGSVPRRNLQKRILVVLGMMLHTYPITSIGMGVWPTVRRLQWETCLVFESANSANKQKLSPWSSLNINILIPQNSIWF